MVNKTHIDIIKETRCPQCNARYRITDAQLKSAIGKAKCGECGAIFNTLPTLKSHANNPPTPPYKPKQEPYRSPPHEDQLSLHEAMYGEASTQFTQLAPLLWFIGILLLLMLGTAQAIYYQRYELISNPRYQQQILSLCEFVPCAKSQFFSKQQLKLLERNVFTHPVKPNALMVTGSFINEAPFAQKLPKLLVSLFDTQGNLIANRLFYPNEYLQLTKDITLIENGKTIQFRVEILDPGTKALTYEFEFL